MRLRFGGNFLVQALQRWIMIGGSIWARKDGKGHGAGKDMDKSWLNIRDRCDKRYIKGIDDFLGWAYNQSNVSSVIRCPCKGYRNTAFKTRIQVRRDLVRKGFWDSYKVWDLHGEVLVRVEIFNDVCNVEVDDDTVETDDIPEMIHDVCGVTNMENMNNYQEENEESNVHAKKFYKLLEDPEKELYPDCKKVSKLSFVVRLLHLKSLNHWSNKSMDALLRFFKEVLPEGSFVPYSFYEVKKALQDLGLGYTKINAYDNDCILYWREYANAESCPKCTESRNVRLGLASDSFQPYGNMSTSHSIWPVILVSYNLPPWDCMKDPYFMMTLLISSPKSPGNDIDVYLQPMIEELKELWKGVETYDAYSKTNFMMRVAIMWTINNFSAYGNLSGWLTKGDEALEKLQSLRNVTYGKGQKRKRNVPNDAYNWRKKSIFFKLPFGRLLSYDIT
ncbi:uncharacterized protein LOC142169788 [Nicotiana tabacum]|uniref:Uncharacterized protein LOC142169788 n=1 Tax=Nicotiana tabacum TaxID=4097 RepID=A0AC58SS42_TOBAC